MQTSVSHNRINGQHPRHQDYLRPIDSCPDKSHLSLIVPEGQLQVHTAPYRGSFSLVLSQALRSAGLGSRVMIAQLLKGGVNQGPEGKSLLNGNLEWLRPAIPCCLTQQSLKENSKELNAKNLEAVQAIWEVCKLRLLKGNLDQLILDEIGLSIAMGYLQEDDLISTLEKRPGSMDVILTGPSMPNRVISMADQVTELRSGH